MSQFETTVRNLIAQRQLRIPDNELNKAFTSIRDEMKRNQEPETKVDQAVSNSERKEIEESLDEKIATKSGSFNLRPEQKFVKSGKFRLDNPGESKGAGHWEIQRNGVDGKTTVAQVKAPDGVQLLLNLIFDQNLQEKYNKQICEKLKVSLNSKYTDSKGVSYIRKSFFNDQDLVSLFRN